MCILDRGWPSHINNLLRKCTASKSYGGSNHECETLFSNDSGLGPVNNKPTMTGFQGTQGAAQRAFSPFFVHYFPIGTGSNWIYSREPFLPNFPSLPSPLKASLLSLDRDSPCYWIQVEELMFGSITGPQSKTPQ